VNDVPARITPAEVRDWLTKSLGARDRFPGEPELAVLAAELTGYQYCNILPEQEFKDFPIRVTDVLGNVYDIKAPLWPGDPPVDWDKRVFDDPRRRAFGHARRFRRTWHDLVPDLAAAFRKALRPANPDRQFGLNYAIASFLEQAIPRITGETPSAATIGRELAGPRPRKRPRKRLR
jgi:hypothetical protein